MPTFLTHAAVPLALGLGLGRRRIPAPLLLAGLAAAVLPDGDVLIMRLGVPYASAFGHRGFSHSILFAGLVALLGAALLRRISFPRAWGFLFLAAVSHPLLDASTTGGLGVALLWPFSEARYFAPWRFIRVSPLRLSSFWSERGLRVGASELRWVWLPCFLLALTGWCCRRTTAPAETSATPRQ